MPSPFPGEYLTIAQVADAKGVATKTIRRMIARGEIEAYRFGPRLIRIPAGAVASALEPMQYREGAA
ncbi:helix-turn-helix domain-containing protein [Microbacterium schleiferi]|uniref:helix-turn-helix domain-containing protein n=1 Tax=Microbacterium schleiferi TaxID=69362 RepID=UPI00311E55C9